MKTELQDKYKEWLLVVANTRLMFNRLDQLEDFLGNHAIRSNGIKRIYNTLPKLRGAFRDLMVEATLMTDGFIDLDVLLENYERASKFYTKYLSRRKEQHRLAKQLLAYHYEPHHCEGVAKNILAVFDKVKEEKIDVALLVLMLLNAIPGYESKDGEVTDIDVRWREVMDFLDDFTHDCGNLVESLGIIIKTREEANKCRLMLIHHTIGLLGIYESYADANALYATSAELKERRVALDLTGYWNECDGGANDTSFWEIENTKDDGLLFATWWYKNAENQLMGTRFTMHCISDDKGRLVAYLMHPQAIKHLIEGQKYGDADHVWYITDMPEDHCPAHLPLVRSLPSNHWRDKLPLTRVTDPSVIGIYDKWMESCEIVKPYGDCEYDFRNRLWGISQDDVYIYDDLEDLYYQVPRDSRFEFDKIKLYDNVGILTMGDKRYLGFDDSMRYIPINDATLREYGITKVKGIT